VTTKRKRLYTTEELRSCAADNRRFSENAARVGNTSAEAYYAQVAERFEREAAKQEAEDERDQEAAASD
jgi:hypothetical protein